MPNRRRLFLGICLWASAATAFSQAVATAEAPSTPSYAVEVWSDATFGPDGRLQQLEVVQTPELSDAFVQRVRSQLAQARIPPVKDASGTPGTFQTGVLTVYQVTPAAAGGTVRLQGMRLEPRPLKRYAAAEPEGPPANTPLQARVQCEVDTQGHCAEAKVLEATGTSDVLRRWALASARGWVFQPQRLNGQALPATVQLTLELTIQDLRPANFRNPLKL